MPNWRTMFLPMMTQPVPSLLPCIERETGPNPTHAVIWLHGLGADGNDFVPIVPELRLPPTPAIRFIFPHAPSQPITINGGIPMRAWYDIRAVDLTQDVDTAGIRHSEAAVRALIHREQMRGIPASHIVLAGFSQGCAITLHTALRLPEKLAGLIGLSGYLPLLDLVAAEYQPANATTPVFLAHGQEDPVVPLSHAIAARNMLQSLAYDVRWHVYPMSHSLCSPEVTELGNFLAALFHSPSSKLKTVSGTVSATSRPS